MAIGAIVSDSADQASQRIGQSRDGCGRNQGRFLRKSRLLTTDLNFKKILALILTELQNCFSVITLDGYFSQLWFLLKEKIHNSLSSCCQSAIWRVINGPCEQGLFKLTNKYTRLICYSRKKFSCFMRTINTPGLENYTYFMFVWK